RQRLFGAPTARTHELPGGRQVAVVAAVVLRAEIDEEFDAVRRQAEIRCARQDGVGESQKAPALTFVAAFLPAPARGHSSLQEEERRLSAVRCPDRTFGGIF